MAGKVSVQRIEKALAKLALIIEQAGGEAYWPIFERLEREREKIAGRREKLERAKERR